MRILACGIFIKANQVFFSDSKQDKGPAKSGKYQEKNFKILVEPE